MRNFRSNKSAIANQTPDHPKKAKIFYVVIFGFGMGGVVVLLPLTVGHFFGLASFSVILGSLWMINALGGALGTYVSGLIYDYTGAYQYALYLFIAAFLVAIAGIFMAGKPMPGGRPSA